MIPHWVSLADVAGRTGLFVDGDWIETKDQNADGDVRLIQLADVGVGEYLNKSSRYLTSATARRLNCTFLEPGDLLVARMPDPIGRACIFPGDTRPCVTAVDVCILRPDRSFVEVAWLKWMINSPTLRKAISQFVKGTTRQRISRTNLGRLQIPYVPLDEQRRTAAILDQADALRRARKRAIDRLHHLHSAIFHEMFGDLAHEPDRWERVTLASMAAKPDDIRCGPFGTQLLKEEFRNAGVPLWGIKHVNALFTNETDEFVDQVKFKQLEGYSIEPLDIVMTRKGTVGNCAVYPHKKPTGVMHSDLLRVRVATERFNPIFVAEQLRCSADVRRQIEVISGGAVMPGINVSRLKALRVAAPPKQLQDEFVQRAIAADNLRSVAERQLAVFDALFASLQHRALRSDLRNKSAIDAATLRLTG